MSLRAWGSAMLGLVVGFGLGWWAHVPPAPAPTSTPAPIQESEVEPELPLPEVDYAALVERARTAAVPPVDREDLATLMRLEDEVFAGLDAVARRYEKHKTVPIEHEAVPLDIGVPRADSAGADDDGLLARRNEAALHYKEVLALSDAAVTSFFTPEVVDGVPWRDLLTTSTVWKKSDAPGFAMELDKACLRLHGPDAGAAGMGVISAGDTESWRDFVVDVEFTIEKGKFELLFRLPPHWQKNVESWELPAFDGELELGRRYECEFRIVASQVEEWNRTLGLGPDSYAINWTQVRKGAFGIAVPHDAEIEFTRLRVKVLR